MCRHFELVQFQLLLLGRKNATRIKIKHDSYVDIGEVRSNTYDCESYMRGFKSHMSTYPTNASAYGSLAKWLNAAVCKTVPSGS